MVLDPLRFIEEVKSAVSGTFCPHKASKRVNLPPEIGGGKWISKYSKVCVKCRKVVKLVNREHPYDSEGSK